MKHAYSTRVPRPLVALGLLLATAGAAQAQAVTFTRTGPFPFTMGGPVDMVVTDVSGDGKPDIVSANLFPNSVNVLLGNGAGSFTALPNAPTPGPNSVPYGLAVGDVNGDGKPDVVTANNGTSTLRVLLGDGTGVFTLQPNVTAVGGAGPYAVKLADVNGDGKLDALLANGFNHSIGVLLGDGAGGFTVFGAPSTGNNTNPYDLEVVDVNSDGKLDVLATGSGSYLMVLLGDGTGGFRLQPNAFPSGSGVTDALAVGDVNLDGKPDVVTGSGLLLLGNGAGGFTQQPGLLPGPVGDPAIGDVNGDGKPDIVATNGTANVLSILLGNGAGGFTAVAAPAIGTASIYSSLTALSDINTDGRLDIVTASYNSGNVVALLNTTATSTAPVLSNISPATGSVGTQVTLTGTNLVGATAVSFNGTAATTFAVINATTITATVPTGATSGPVTVTTPGGTATSPYSFVVRTPPTTVADAYTTPAGVTLTGNVLTNDLGTNPRAILINRPTHGTLVLNPDGTFTYQPAAGYTGSDSFVYYACNVGAALICGDPATVSISVLPIGPVTVADAYTTPQNVTLTGNVLTNDLGTNPRAILIIRPTHGTLVLNPDGLFSYQPAAGYTGPDSFIYYACAMGTPLVCGDPATVSITVTLATPSLTAAKPTVASARGTAVSNGSATEALALTASPNPFGEELRLRFALPTTEAYTLALYDGQGRLVQQLASGQAEAGQPQELVVPTHTYATGLYLVRLTTPTATQLLKLIKQ